MDTMQAEQSNESAREQAPKPAEKEKPSLTRDEALLFKEMFKANLETATQRAPLKGKDKNTDEDMEKFTNFPMPDFSARLASATPEMRAHVKNALKVYQGKLDAWTEEMEKKPENQRTEAEKALFEERNLKTDATDAIFEALSKADQAALEKEAASIPSIEVQQAPAPEKEKVVVNDDAEWASAKAQLLEKRTKAVEAWLGKDEETPSLQKETASEPDFEITEAEPVSISQISNLIEAKLKTASTNPHDFATATEQIQELGKYDANKAAEYHKQLVDVMTKPEASNVEKMPRALSIAESYALAESARAEAAKAAQVQEEKPVEGITAMSPAAERMEPAIRDLGIVINAEANTELPPEQEAKAQDSKRVMEYFSELPGWFKKGWSKLSNAMFESLPPDREYGRLDNFRKIEHGGAGELYARAKSFDTSGKTMPKVEKPRKEMLMNQEELASLALQMSDKLVSEYPDRVKEIELAGAKSTAPELSFTDIADEMNSSETPYNRKLDLQKELNARYEAQREYGRRPGNAQMEV